MRNRDIQPKESTTAFAIAALLLNLLIVTVLCSGILLAYELVTRDDMYGAMLRQGFWQ